MNVIQPALFTVINRFPDRRNAAIRLFKQSEVFKSACMDYQDCDKALRFWSRSKKIEATMRKREYEELLSELEEEIIQNLEQGAGGLGVLPEPLGR